MGARRVAPNHYVASVHHTGHSNQSNHLRGYSTDDGGGGGSDRTMSEYMIANERVAPPQRKYLSHQQLSVSHQRSPSPQPPSRQHRLQVPTPSTPHNGRAPSVASYARSYGGRSYDNDGSEIYVTSAAYKAPSEISRYSRGPPSQYSYRSGPGTGRAPPSVASTRTRTSRKGGLMVETMSAPNPFCPNTRGVCCLMLLLNLGLILVTLGFVIVIQFFEPLFVWILGIVFLVFGFLTLIGSLIYCVFVFKDAKSPKEVNPDELYWTHHWQKHIGPSEIHYRGDEPIKYTDPDRMSDRYSVTKYSDRGSHRSGPPASRLQNGRRY